MFYRDFIFTFWHTAVLCTICICIIYHDLPLYVKGKSVFVCLFVSSCVVVCRSEYFPLSLSAAVLLQWVESKHSTQWQVCRHTDSSFTLTGCLASGSVVLMLCVMLTVSGEAPGVDVTHKEVERDTAGRRPGERHTYKPLPETHTTTLPEVTQLAGIKISSIESTNWH